jgi:hypothetical protein
MTVAAYSGFVEAQVELSRLIAERYGDDPAVLDDLTIKSLPVKIQGSEKTALALYAHRAAGVRDMDDVLMVIHAQPHVMPLILATDGGQHG